MKPYFATDEMRARLMHHATQLLGTPFAPHQCVPGAGIDCVNVNRWTYRKCDLLIPELPHYSMDGGKHNEQSQLLNWFNGCQIFQRVEVRPPTSDLRPLTSLPGDTLCFKFRSQTEHHVGLKLLGPFFIHCLAGRRVEMATLQDHTFARTLAAIYRPISPQIRGPLTPIENPVSMGRESAKSAGNS